MILAEREQLLLWQLTYELTTKHRCRLVRMNEEQNEIWLETTRNKHVDLVRLIATDFDWSNWLKRDCELAGIQAEGMRKLLRKRNVQVLNIYISEFPPVDDFEYVVAQPLIVGRGRTAVQTFLLTRDLADESFAQLDNYFLGLSEFCNTDHIEYDDVRMVKQAVIHKATEQVKQEQELFQQGKPFFTYLFIIVQVFMFLIVESMGGSTDVETLIAFGAKYNPLILAGEWWRLITPIFLHIGLLHLFMNTLALYYLGSMVERIFGRFRFLFIYLIAGIAGSVASFLFSSSLSAGASGAIFGCFGALLYIGVTNPQLFFRTMGMNVLFLVGINLVFGFTIPGIDNAGHIGGLVGGFLATGIVHFPKKRKWHTQILFLLLTTATLYLMLHLGYKGDRPDVINARAQQYIQQEEFEEAHALLMDYAKKGKADEVSYFQLAYAEIHLHQLTAAKEHLALALELRPEFHEAHFNLALIYYEEQNMVKAREHAEEAYKLSKEKKYDEFIRELGDN